MLSNTCKYALRSIIYIGIKSESGQMVNVRTIASELDVPMQFLSKILQNYVRKGFLKSFRGPTGGFTFDKKPKNISLYDLIVVIDGEDVFNSCIIGTKSCNSTDVRSMKCPVHDEYSEVRKQLVSFFKNETIDSIIKNYENKEKSFLAL